MFKCETTEYYNLDAMKAQFACDLYIEFVKLRESDEYVEGRVTQAIKFFEKTFQDEDNAEDSQ